MIRMNGKSKNDVINMRRTQLTNATYKVVGEKGYYDFTIKDIAKEAGLSTGLVHYYFKNKEDLLLNLLKEMNKNITTYLNRGISNVESPSGKLEVFVTQAFNLVTMEKNYFYVIMDFWTQVNKNDRMSRAIKKLFKSYRDECGKILKEGISIGEFVDMDIDYTSTVIVSVMMGLILQYVLDNSAFGYEDYTSKAKQHIRELVLLKKIS